MWQQAFANVWKGGFLPRKSPVRPGPKYPIRRANPDAQARLQIPMRRHGCDARRAEDEKSGA